MAQEPFVFVKDDADKVPPLPPGKHPLAPISGADFERRSWRLPAQAWLVITLCALVPLLALLVALWRGFENLFLRWPWLADATLVGLLAVFLVVIAGVAHGIYGWARAKAMHARVVRTRWGNPADVQQVLDMNPMQLEILHAHVEVAHAPYRQFPNLSTNTGGRAPEKPVEAQVLPAPQEGLTPFDTWRVWADEAPHLILAAETKGGKTTTAKALLGPRIDAGEHVFIIDPHSDDWFGLPNVGGGENWAEVGQAMDSIIAEYQQRMQERDRYLRETGHSMPVESWTRLNVLLDEANITCQRFDVSTRRDPYNRWEEFAKVLGSGARKVRISITLLCQSANVDDLGLTGSMRRNFFRIGLDHAVARLMLRDEPNHERRKLLHTQLEGQQFPAVCEYRGQFYALDRTGVDRVPAPRAPQPALWPGWSNAPKEVKPSAEEALIKAIQTAKEKGWTREMARAAGLHFDNGLWSQITGESA